MNSTPPTAEQLEAIAARGDVLVVAGAGAGKTRTLVDRCLAWLLDDKNQGGVDEILMVTFTKAAAAEMRRRLRAGLESAPLSSTRLAEQLALLDTAHICTLHSFCFHLVCEHFYELGLDPQLRVLSDEETQMLARQSLEALLEEVYNSETPADLAIQQLIQAQGGDWDQPVRDLIRRLHNYSQTLRDPTGWFAAQHARFQSAQPGEWRAWLMEHLETWRRSWLPVLQRQPPANANAAQCAAALAALPPQPARPDFAAALASIVQADKVWPRPRGPWRDPIKEIFAEAAFLLSVCAEGRVDPLAEDWDWVRPSMLALLDAAARFGEAFAQAKRHDGGIDYHDLEQFALRLLHDGGRPGAIAEKWRKKLRLVFVDEFQDINGAQEAIIEALSRGGAEANRFLVGDVKQSIYRFRLADPGIFARCQAQWAAPGASARVLGLAENFRSHEGILNFVNAVFSTLMRQEVGGVPYPAEARLRFGAPALRAALAARPNSPPPVELHVRCRGRDAEDDEAAPAVENASDAEMEARMVGRRLKELHGTPLLDQNETRPMQWRDVVILLRSPRNKVEAYVKEFHRLGIPLAAARGGFYDSLEARDLLAILQLLDNPLQDLPLLAVLRSPLAGLASAELALIRAARPQGRFWTALVDWHREEARKNDPARAALRDKAGRFLARFRAWRRQSRQAAVSLCLENILDQTHYTDWLLTRERGEQRRANVERFLQLARQFDAGRGESLPRFLRFLQAQQESDAEAEPPPAPESDAVRLMSIHQSKGQEFPVVVVADLGKKFNLADLRERVILDDSFGLCPQVKPPGAARFYPSLPWWLAQRRQKRELLGEELRLLYVAMTRAAQRLILAGGASRKAVDERWPARAARGLGPSEILNGADYLDWLGPWLAGPNKLSDAGANELLSWKIYRQDDGPAPAAAPIPPPEQPDLAPEIRDRLDWSYPFAAETGRPAKVSVSGLRRRIAGADEQEPPPMFRLDSSRFPRSGKEGALTAAQIGSAHHAFLERMSLEVAPTAAGLAEEAARLGRENVLSPEQIACLDFDGLAVFWQSEAGAQLRRQSPFIRRELPFTARFAASDLARLGAEDFAAVGAGEFVVVQGVIDLAALLPEEIWLLDFKTDHFPAGQLPEKIKMYRPQLDLYAEAISRIHRRPVTRRWLHFLAHRYTVLL
ncbi:MAG: UvrD-helicase domain-containing protein [Verrucomicrobiota bacterium]